LGTNLHEFLDLGDQPLANEFSNGMVPLNEYPLKVVVCTDCWHSQLTAAVHPYLMFNKYLYRSGTSETLQQYFHTFAHRLAYDHGWDKSILDIGCNDGSFLSEMERFGWVSTGVDPSVRFHPDIVGYWEDPDVHHAQGPFDVITAMNVFAHTNYLDDFLNACSLTMLDDSRLYIQTSQRDWIINGEFDVVYHEHQNFFTVSSMNTLLQRHGMSLTEVKYPEIHGGSTIYTIKLGPSKWDGLPWESLNVHMNRESELGLYDINTYNGFGARAQETVELFRDTLRGYQEMGHEIVGYGAAAKANTLINSSGAYLDYIVDDNEWKVGYVTPGENIPVVPSSFIEQLDGHVVFVILAWNFKDEIIKKIKQRLPTAVTDTTFITAFPDFTIETGE
jgi:SAM-dependent methyltransferase